MAEPFGVGVVQVAVNVGFHSTRPIRVRVVDGGLILAFMKLSEILAFAEIRTHDHRAEIHLLLPSEQSEPLLSLRPNVRGSLKMILLGG